MTESAPNNDTPGPQDGVLCVSDEVEELRKDRDRWKRLADTYCARLEECDHVLKAAVREAGQTGLRISDQAMHIVDRSTILETFRDEANRCSVLRVI